MESTSKVSVPILTEHSFSRWKGQVRNVLEAEELLAIVDGMEAMPAEGDAVNRKLWKKRDAKARAILSTSLDDLHDSFVRGCASSKAIMDKLVTMYERKSAGRKYTAWQELFDIKWEVDMPAAAFLASINAISHKLESLDEKPKDTILIGKVLSSLPAKLESFQQSWNLTKTGNDVTFADLQSSLMNAELALKVKQEPPDTDGTAFFGKNKRRTMPAKKQSDKKDIRCFQCDEKGHFKRDCPSLKHQGKGSSGTGSGFTAGMDRNWSQWIGDSGAYRHLTGNRSWFSQFTPAQGEQIQIGDGTLMPAEGIGRVDVEVFNGKTWTRSFLDDVRFVPTMGDVNLFSLGAATSKGHVVTLAGKSITLKKDGVVSLVGEKRDNMYHMLIRTVTKGAHVSAGNLSIDLWHERLCHIGEANMKSLVSEKMATGITLPAQSRLSFCEGCQYGRMERKPFKPAEERECQPGENIHSDVAGPIHVTSVGKSRFIVVFKDEATSFRRLFFVKEKSEVLNCFKDFVNEVEAAMGCRQVKRFRSDGAKEYLSQDFTQYLRSKGIVRETSPAYTPQSNGFVERENRTLLEKARSMLWMRNMPAFLWAEAVATAAYVLNRLPTCRQKGTTPFELWTRKKPDLSHLRIFGCDAFVLMPAVHRKKLDRKAEKGIFVGYGKSDSIFRVYMPAKRNVFESREVNFNETLAGKVAVFNDLLQDKSSAGINDQDEQPDVEGEEDGQPADESSDKPLDFEDAQEDVVTPARRGPGRPAGSQNKPKPPAVPHKMDRRKPDERKIPSRFGMLARLADPQTVEEALAGEDAADWESAMQEEMDALLKNKTWELVHLPAHQRTVKNKWVFRRKRNPDGTVCRHKARLCAKGFSQRAGIDYDEVYAPVVRYESVRILLAVAAHHRLHLMQFDVKTAFLHGDLEEEIFMDQPACFDDGTGRICRLLKGLYGLKQAPRQWNRKFDDFLQRWGLQPAKTDPCIYHCRHDGKGMVLLAIYVDDGLLCCEKERTQDEILVELRKCFEVTAGTANTYVGLEIDYCRQKGKVTVTQAGYIEQLLQRFGMSDCKSISTPADTHTKLTKSMCLEQQPAVKFPYREAVGCLMWLSVCSRPDITFHVNQVARFCDDAGKEHVQAVKRIFRYLAGTRDLKLTYGGSSLELMGFCDSDYAGCLDTRRSTAGIILMLNGGPVYWSSKRMKTVAQSSTEAEYMALALASNDIRWHRQLLKEIGCRQSHPTVIKSDSNGAIQLAGKQSFSPRTKHIDVRVHLVRSEKEQGNIVLDFVGTKEQPADMLTKALCGPAFTHCRQMIHMVGHADGLREGVGE